MTVMKNNYGNTNASEKVKNKPHSALSREDIAIAAYFLAQTRGFESGGELNDWLQAEKEIKIKAEEGLNQNFDDFEEIQQYRIGSNDDVIA